MDSKDNDKQLQIEFVSKCILDLLLRLNREAGIPMDLLLATAHGQIVTTLAAAVGGTVAAERCMAAAEEVRSIPSAADVALAAAKPHGTA